MSYSQSHHHTHTFPPKLIFVGNIGKNSEKILHLSSIGSPSPSSTWAGWFFLMVWLFGFLCFCFVLLFSVWFCFVSLFGLMSRLSARTLFCFFVFSVSWTSNPMNWMDILKLKFGSFFRSFFIYSITFKCRKKNVFFLLNYFVLDQGENAVKLERTWLFPLLLPCFSWKKVFTVLFVSAKFRCARQPEWTWVALSPEISKFPAALQKQKLEHLRCWIIAFCFHSR